MKLLVVDINISDIDWHPYIYLATLSQPLRLYAIKLKKRLLIMKCQGCHIFRNKI
jgi:hypothetical protein